MMAGLGFHIPYVQRDIHYVQVDIHYVQMEIDYVQLAPATPLSTCPTNYRFSTVLSTVPFARTGPCNATFYLTHELQHKLAPKKASDFPPPPENQPVPRAAARTGPYTASPGGHSTFKAWRCARGIISICFF